jgi:hypothetical protein
MHAFGRGEGFAQSSITFRPCQCPQRTTAAGSGGRRFHVEQMDLRAGALSVSFAGRTGTSQSQQSWDEREADRVLLHCPVRHPGECRPPNGIGPGQRQSRRFSCGRRLCCMRRSFIACFFPCVFSPPFMKLHTGGTSHRYFEIVRHESKRNFSVVTPVGTSVLVTGQHDLGH